MKNKRISRSILGLIGLMGLVFVLTGDAARTMVSAESMLPTFVSGFFSTNVQADEPAAPQVDFTNSGPIFLNDSPANGTPGLSDPYGSPIVVSGLGGTVTDVNLRINGFTHTYPGDINLLLVGPGGQSFIFQAFVGSVGNTGNPVVNITYTLDDQAAAQIPLNGPMTSGTFRPTAQAATITGVPVPFFPAPAPVPCGNPRQAACPLAAPGGPGTFASAFNGISPNGTWRLYGTDFGPLDEGDISGGWTLQITTSGTPTPTNTPTATPTATPTNTPTATPTVAPTATPTNTPTATPTVAPTATPTNTPTATPTVAPTATPTNTPTATPTVAPTATPTNTPTATPTVVPTATPTNTPTATPTPPPGGASTIYAVDARNTDFDSLTTTNPLATRIVPVFTGNYFGGDFAANDFTQLYAINSVGNSLNRIAVATGVVTPVGTTGAPVGAGTWGDMSYDRTTGTMYAMSNSTTTGTTVYTVNLTTGLATVVASNGVATNTIIDGGIHPTTGVYYGVDITADNLVTINKTTAAVTIIGPVGVPATFAQGMDFEDSTGILYWAAYRGAAVGPGQLRTINLTTGATTLIGDITNGVAGETVELDAFAIASSAGGPTPTPTATPTLTPTPTATPTPGAGVCTASYTGPPVAVPDNVPAGVNITIPVTGVGTLTDLNFRFDTAGACDATVGNTNAAADHTFIGDFTFKLTAPNGTTTTTFQARRGGTRENICSSLLDDEGGFPNISTLTSVTGQPQSGNFSPETTGTFAALDGVNANGNWTLNVSDNAGIDTGSMRRFSLVMTGTACAGGTTPTPTNTPTATPTATPTNTPTATPTATPTNTVQFSAASYINDESTVGDVPQQTVVTVTRTGTTTGVTTVTAGPGGTGTANVGATCTGNADIAAAPVVLTFAAGELSKTFNVTNCPDTLYEVDETRQFTLTGASGGGVGAQGTTNVIVNDTANQFRNVTPIDTFQGLQSVGSPIIVTGGPTNVHRIRVTLYDFYHAFPDNIKVLLVNPQGRKYILMGDAGGAAPILQNGNVTLTFTDLAGQVLPDSTPLTRGKFEPTNWQTTINDFLPPAPAGPYIQPGSTVGGTIAQTMFGNFGQLDGNGPLPWTLYIRDDNGGNSPTVVNGQVLGGWGLELLAATASGVEVSGRVLTPDGRGLRNAIVSMVDSQGVVRTATTSSFGYYSFDGVEAGSSVVMSVESRRYRFAPRIVQVIDTLTDVDFQGQE